LREITVVRRPGLTDAAPVTAAGIQHELDLLSAIHVGDGTRAVVHRRHLEAMLCAARLQEALDRAERWYERRAETLRNFDRRATATVQRLVADARVQPSLVWSTYP
jgi:hypothetical protein